MMAEKMGFDPDRLDRIAPWMQSYVDRQRYPGASVVVRRGGQEVYAATCGLRDIEAGQPFTRDTVARIYSMTKPITSLAIMQFVERGLFPLDTPVSEFLPAFGDMHALVPGAERIDQTEPCATPTLHQLLTHTSGLSYSFNIGLVPTAMVDSQINFNPRKGPLADMADRAAELPLAFAPGASWQYSIATDILGRVVEVVSGKTLDRAFQDAVFDPLGMTETGFAVPADAVDRFAALYTPLSGDPMALTEKADAPSLNLSEPPGTSDFLDPTTFSGGGGLVGTIDDYMRFVEMLRMGGALDGERVIGARTLDFMRRNHLPGDIASMGPESFAEQPMVGMGFGLGGSVVLDPARARIPGSVGDFSWGGMASTFFWTDPVLDLSVVFFTQLSPSSSYPSRSELKALVHGALIP